jgi:hypothetical protein
MLGRQLLAIIFLVVLLRQWLRRALDHAPDQGGVSAKSLADGSH